MMSFIVDTAYMQYTGKRDEYLAHIHSEYLSNWDICVSTAVLKDVLFNNYAQAYSAVKRMAQLGLLVGSEFVKGYYEVVIGE